MPRGSTSNLRETGSIQSVERALGILELLSRTQQPITVSEISETLHINRTTVYGLLNTLIQNGYIAPDGSGKYTVSGKMYSISYSYPNRLPVVRTAASYMIDMVEKLNLTTHLGTLSAKNDILLLKAQFPRNMQNARSGSIFPIYASGMGKVILAYSEEAKQEEILSSMEFRAFTKHTVTSSEKLREELAVIREQGYSRDQEEYLYGVSCVAFPILNDKNKIIAAISISGTPQDIDERFDQIITEGLRCSKSCSMDMGWDIYG